MGIYYNHVRLKVSFAHFCLYSEYMNIESL